VQLLAFADEVPDRLVRLGDQDGEPVLDANPFGDVQLGAVLPLSALPADKVEPSARMPAQGIFSKEQKPSQAGHGTAVATLY